MDANKIHTSAVMMIVLKPASKQQDRRWREIARIDSRILLAMVAVHPRTRPPWSWSMQMMIRLRSGSGSSSRYHMVLVGRIYILIQFVYYYSTDIIQFSTVGKCTRGMDEKIPRGTGTPSDYTWTVELQEKHKLE